VTSEAGKTGWGRHRDRGDGPEAGPRRRAPALLAATYEQVHDALAEVLTAIGLSDAARAKVFGENARRVYAQAT
jgi:hypothetical protein